MYSDRRCDLGDIAQQGDILRAATELIVRNGRGDRFAAGRVVFLGIGLDVEAALGDLRCVLEVLHQVVLADIQQFDAHVAAEIGLVDQRLDPAPGRFDALEVLVVHHGVQLAADLRVQGCDVFVQQRLVEAFDFLRGLFQQIKENTDGGSHAFIRGRFGKCIAILVDLDIRQLRYRVEIDLVEQAGINTVAFMSYDAGASSVRNRSFRRRRHESLLDS